MRYFRPASSVMLLGMNSRVPAVAVNSSTCTSAARAPVLSSSAAANAAVRARMARCYAGRARSRHRDRHLLGEARLEVPVAREGDEHREAVVAVELGSPEGGLGDEAAFR